MSAKKAWKKDTERDATLVEAAMAGYLVPLAIGMGLTPDEAFVHHPAWLKRQSKEYRDKVVEAVIILQDKMLARMKAE